MARVERALISVSDKTGIVEFARALAQREVQILSTGGTAKLLREAGLTMVEVSSHTGFPEMMDGRLKTLHPKVHGGLLGRRDVDAEAMRAHGIAPIDLLVVNLYPFEQTVARPECTLAEAIENIDIGGPAMLRAAAKNHAFVGVLVDAADYPRVIAEMDANAGALGDELRFDLAVKAFEQTPDPYQAMREVFRVLKPGSKLRVQFESYDRLEKPLTERGFLTDADDILGYHYVLQHRRPAWERSYMVKFEPTPEMRDEFRKLGELVERLGDNPAQNPELGMQFLERNQERVSGASWYELEHFTSLTLKESLEEVGFVNVRVAWSCASLAGAMWSRVRSSDLTSEQMRDVLKGLADVTARIDAPAGLGEPVVATRPR